jgi:hypothetical protein
MAAFLEGFDERHPAEERADDPADLGNGRHWESSGDTPRDSDSEVGTPEEPPKDTAPDDAAPDTDSGGDGKPDEGDLRREVATLEKRMKDNQASYTREHQRVLELEKELAALRERAAARPDADPDADPDEGDGDWFADGEKDGEGKTEKDGKRADAKDPLQERLDRIEQKLEEAQRQEALREWRRKEEAFRAGHEDYDELVEQFVVPEFERSPETRRRWEAEGATPEKAYELAKRLKLTAEIAADPEAYKEQLRQELMESRKDDGTPRKRPARVSGSSTPPPAEADGRATGILDEVFGG